MIKTNKITKVLLLPSSLGEMSIFDK
jgi:hypothetical protein